MRSTAPRGCDKALRIEPERPHGILGAIELGKRKSCLRLEHSNRAIMAACCDEARCGIEHDGTDASGPGNLTALLATRRIPNSNGAVEICGAELLAVGREHDDVNRRSNLAKVNRPIAIHSPNRDIPRWGSNCKEV